MTATDSSNRKPGAAAGAMGFDCFGGIGGTGRDIAATRRSGRGRCPVYSDELEQDCLHDGAIRSSRQCFTNSG